MEQNKSSSKVGLIVAAAVVLVVAGVVVYAMNDESSKTDAASEQTKTTDTSKTNGSVDTSEKAVVGSTVITFTDKGFDKTTYRSKSGEAVTVKNASSMDMQFSSDDHPSHLENQELNLDVMGPGETATFTPASTGTYGFHDHIEEQFTGTLIVE